MPLERDFIDQVMGAAKDKREYMKRNQEEYENRQGKIDRMRRQGGMWGLMPGLVGAGVNAMGLMGMGATGEAPPMDPMQGAPGEFTATGSPTPGESPYSLTGSTPRWQRNRSLFDR
jgi:hypothetical protein